MPDADKIISTWAGWKQRLAGVSSPIVTECWDCPRIIQRYLVSECATYFRPSAFIRPDTFICPVRGYSMAAGPENTKVRIGQQKQKGKKGGGKL